MSGKALRYPSYTCSRRIFIVSCLSLLVCLLFRSLFSLVAMNDLLVNQQIVNVQMAVPEMRILGDTERKGLLLMQQHSVTIVGLARNAASKLPSVLRQVEILGGMFRQSRAIFAEGDSTDASREILQEWTARSQTNRTLLDVSNLQGLNETEGHFAGQSMPREGRIGTARNTLIDFMRMGGTKQATDFVIVVDLDILGWDVAGVANSFGLGVKHMKWDVMCSNGILMHGVYRDTYAFRVAGINTNHHMAGDDYDKYNISETQRKTNRRHLENSQQEARAVLSGSSTTGMILQVESCFGGLAIYKFDQFHGCEYGYRHKESPYMLDCEHVIFNKCLKERFNATVFTNPAMKLWYGHTSLRDIKSVSKTLGSVSHWISAG